jgi:hypothetical protein
MYIHCTSAHAYEFMLGKYFGVKQNPYGIEKSIANTFNDVIKR